MGVTWDGEGRPSTREAEPRPAMDEKKRPLSRSREGARKGRAATRHTQRGGHLFPRGSPRRTNPSSTTGKKEIGRASRSTAGGGTCLRATPSKIISTNPNGFDVQQVKEGSSTKQRGGHSFRAAALEVKRARHTNHRTGGVLSNHLPCTRPFSTARAIAHHSARTRASPR